MLRCLLVPIGVVKHKLMVLDVLCDAIYFDLGLMHLNMRVEATNSVNFALDCLLFKKRPFTHTDANIHLV
jgi:hypothetical protein